MTRPWTSRQIQDYYSKCLAEHGSGPQAVGWGSKASQELRFKLLVEVAGGVADMQGRSVLDVGCGTGDLYEYLLSAWRECGAVAGTYCGYDSNEVAIRAANSRFGLRPEIGTCAHFRLVDLADWIRFGGCDLTATWDYILASGLFAFAYLGAFETFVWWMYRRARKALAFNVLSSWAPEHRPGHFYLEPARALAIAARIQREVDGGPGRIVLRHDYLPHDMTLYMYRGERA